MSKQKLTRKQANQVAKQIQQMNNGNGKVGKTGGSKKSSGNFMWGALAGIAAAAVAPLLAPKLRPAVREVIKGGIATGRYLQKKAEGIQEDFQDLTAEARSELDTTVAEAEG